VSRQHAAEAVVLWHDIECGGYGEDLPLWRELAAAAGPGTTILDVGAGTGRVTLHLAHRGFAMVALDADARLLGALARRAAGLDVRTVAADARDFDLGERFALIIVPMQTVQLLDGSAGREAFLRCAQRHLQPGGRLVLALADALDCFDEEHDQPPLPDVADIDGVLYFSRPIAVRDEGERVALERIRETVDRQGRRTAEGDVIRLDRVDAAMLEGEARAAGLRVLPRRTIPQTEEYVGSEVVVLGA
jgi:SAM-dependent methyltransferase